MKKRRPSASLGLALIAVILACAGSATAASVITGKQIRDGSVTGEDIRDGSIGQRDLAAAVRNTARATSGPAGAAGPAGAPGRDGRDGVGRRGGPRWRQRRAGSPRASPASAATRSSRASRKQHRTACGHYSSSATARPARSLWAAALARTSGAAASSQRVGQLILSAPTPDNRGWMMIFAKGDMSTVTVDTWVICAKVAA